MSGKLKSAWEGFAARRGVAGGLQFFMLGRFGGAFVVSVLLAKASLWAGRPLSTADIGVFELFLFFSGFVDFVWINALVKGALGFAELAGAPRPELDRRMAQLFYLFSALAAAFAALFGAAEAAFGLFDLPGGLVLAAALLHATLLAPSVLLEYLFVLRGTPRPLYISGLLTPAAYLATVVAGMLLGGLDGAILGAVAYAAARFAASAAVLLRGGAPRPDWRFARRLLAYASPLVLAAVLAESGVYIDGVLVNALFDGGQFALFRYGARELPTHTILTAALSNAMIPLLAAAADPTQALAEIKARTRRLLHLLAPAAIVVMLLSDRLFVAVYNPDFAQSALVFDIYLLLLVPRMAMCQTVIVGMRRNGLMVWVSGIEVATNAGLSLWWGTWFGVGGVAMATVASFVAERLTMIILARRRLGVSARSYVPLRELAAYAAALAGVFVWKHALACGAA